MELMNFTELPSRKKSYGGANGNKISVVFNNELYMLYVIWNKSSSSL